MLTPKASERIEETVRESEAERWTPRPAHLTALETEIKQAAANGELQRQFKASPYHNEREDAVERLIRPRLAKRFATRAVAFKASMPDHGGCRFFLRIGKNYEEAMNAPEVFVDWNCRLLMTDDDWAEFTGRPAPKPRTPPPKPVEPQKAEPLQAPKADLKRRAQVLKKR